MIIYFGYGLTNSKLANNKNRNKLKLNETPYQDLTDNTYDNPNFVDFETQQNMENRRLSSNSQYVGQNQTQPAAENFGNFQSGNPNLANYSNQQPNYSSKNDDFSFFWTKNMPEIVWVTD